ncbi:hypothetical protein HP439_18360 [Sphingobacterium shayense]|uniref:hypothetical protein n=1 Tax=Sphingobacterium shayense TaxID=626343 RepID=UPI00155731D3|nr:hypothetical protein [Sphingobacterium shayense]NQD72690.1 hypothetical protein [Sphingobacterium shayense]
MSQENLLKEIEQIRSMMEKSSKFISISGLSGVLIGIYALIGAAFAYVKVYGFNSDIEFRDYYIDDPDILKYLSVVAAVVLVLSIVTGLSMASRKAKYMNQKIWNVVSRSLLFAIAVPLCTGGLFALILLSKGYYSLIASVLLIFYGLALVSGSPYTFKEVRWLGIFEILLGLLAILVPGYGLWFWVAGFGILHIVYGLIVYKKYE